MHRRAIFWHLITLGTGSRRRYTSIRNSLENSLRTFMARNEMNRVKVCRKIIRCIVNFRAKQIFKSEALSTLIRELIN